MLKKGPEQLGPPMFGQERSCDFVGQIVEVCGNEVGHLAIFGVAPGMIDDIQLRGVSREVVDMHLLVIEGSEESIRFLVPAETIPDHEQGPLEMAAQLLHKRKEIVAREVLRAHGEIKAYTLLYGGNGDRTSHREAIVAIPTVMDGRVAPRRPRPADRGLEHEAGFIDENERASLTPGFF
jgi:hypothetical protein